MLLLQTTVITNSAVNTPTSGSFFSGFEGSSAKATADVAGYLSKVNWSAPSWDLFIVLFFIVTVFLYGLSLGRDRVIVILVSIYMAMAVIANAPYLEKITQSADVGHYFAFRVTAFLGVFLLLFFLLSRSALQRTFGNLAAGRWWQVFIFSTFHVGLLVSVTLSFLPAESIQLLAPITRTVFASEAGRFFWIVAPIFSMMVLKIE